MYLHKSETRQGEFYKRRNIVGMERETRQGWDIQTRVYEQ